VEWVLIVGGVIAFVVYRSSKGQKRANKPQASQTSLQPSRYALAPPRNRFDSRPNAQKQVAQARWVPVGEAIKVGAYKIDGGMLYLGGILPGQREGQCGNCVVDPTCSVASSGEDRAGSSLPYWPSFQSASPTARRTYLDWLAAGREDPDIGIGYVFLFFYGLERRLFVDKVRLEAPALILEVQRLLQLHGANGSFRNYATRFLDAAALMASQAGKRPSLSPEMRGGYEMPIRVRVYLGRKLATKSPLDATDALMWVLSLPDTSLRTPATRCFDELVQLWECRFAARYPNGLKINPPRTRLKLEYRAASGSFTEHIEVADATGPLPDIAAISAPITALRDLLGACTEELSPYSRLLGKNPEALGTLDAALLLPKELGRSAVITDVGRRIDRLFNGRNVVSVRVPQLAEALSLDIAGLEKIPTGLSNQIGGYLDYLDVAFEPDRRFGSSPLRPEGHAVLFKAPGGGTVNGDAPPFSAARAMVEVAALAAGADDKVDSGEIDAITAEIRNFPELGKLERARLIAYADALLKDQSLHRFAFQKLKALDAGAKQAVVKSATAAILADGHASPAEVKFLERLYKAMALPVDGVYAMLHRGGIVVDEPVAVEVERRSPGVAIPLPPSATPRSSVQIDLSRLERLKSETSIVSELLAGIFVEEEPSRAIVPAAVREANAPVRFSGLDTVHAALLEEVLRGGSLDRELFDDKARSLRLLPDGAIERINDWGFDQFEEPILEGDELLTVAPHILAELTQAEAAA